MFLYLKRYVRWIALLIFLVPVTGLADTNTPPIRIGLAAVVLDRPGVLLDDWSDYLTKELNQPVKFVQRRSYSELTDELEKGSLQASWVCTYPYITHRDTFRLLVIPVFKNQPIYHSYLIASANNNTIKDISDLQGKVFAYTESESFSGYIIPRYWLEKLNFNPDSFFRMTFFTWSHKDSIIAVSDGLADAAAVDSYVWESMQKDFPEIVNKTRIVTQSKDFGFPPIVAGLKMTKATFLRLQTTLINMNRDPEGKSLLHRMHLDRFDMPDYKIYKTAIKLLEKTPQ